MCLLGIEELHEDHRCLALGSWAMLLQVSNHKNSQSYTEILFSPESSNYQI